MAMPGSSHFIDLTVDDEDDQDFTPRNSRTAARVKDRRPQEPLQLGSVIELTDSSDEDVNLKAHPNLQSRHKKHPRHKRPKLQLCSSSESDDEIIELNSSPETSPARGKAKTNAGHQATNVTLENEALARHLAHEEGRNGSDDEIIELSNSAVASPTKGKGKGKAQEHSILQDEALARRLALEYEEANNNRSAHDIAEDEELARRLAKEEERSLRQLMSKIEKKKEGIVFSVVVNAADNTLHDGSPAHPDDLERFEPWKKLCEGNGLKVKKCDILVHWFVNYELEKRFEAACDKLEQVMGKRSEELQLFHGTAAPNIESILNGGFRIGGVGDQRVVNGTAMGYGIYFATHAATSLGYAMGGNKIFACRGAW
ncbi:hypothetical protein DXG03_001008 [Asterophora parasitica]|uniref:Poly [ADP-ribose] polymerase n=1 Tax=Asterophora parasitica TaxID=117018 RepID=A0A9P7KAI5_9AGAR|nr:hypothetical protein DXG03_001008 [Asterophora parasitica]